MYPSQPDTPLRRYFAGLTEFAFESRLGLADPPLVEYIAELLTRFIHADAIYSVRDLAGRRLDQVADMLIEADARLGDARREAHRHIGDFVLFWSGVYPEAMQRLQGGGRKDSMLDYPTEGKRAYYVASRIRSTDTTVENELLERLSHDFELCVYGLGEIRREWQRRDDSGDLRLAW